MRVTGLEQGGDDGGLNEGEGGLASANGKGGLGRVAFRGHDRQDSLGAHGQNKRFLVRRLRQRQGTKWSAE